MGLSPDEIDLIALAREGEAPSEAARHRMRANVMARVGVGAAAGATVATTSAAAKAGASSGVLSIWTKLTLGAVVLGTVGGGSYLAVSAPPPTSKLARIAPQVARLTEVVDAPEPAVPTAAGASVTSEEASANAPPARVPVVPSAFPVVPSALPARPSRVAPTGTNSIKDELALLRQAQQRLNGGDADDALSLLEDHQRSHPDGRLKQERMAVRVFALCKAGRRDEARAAAQRFLAEAPGSPLAPRVARACRQPTPKKP